MDKFDPMGKPFGQMSESEQAWLRDQHPRGAAIIEANKAKFQRAEAVEVDTDVPPYEKWSAKELADELQARNLSKSGVKDDLVARLYENDRQNES